MTLTKDGIKETKREALERVSVLEEKVQQAKRALSDNDFQAANDLFSNQSNLKRMVQNIGYDCMDLDQSTCAHPEDREFRYDGGCQCMACGKVFPAGKPNAAKTT